MRQGELLGLKWEDVDLTVNAIRVRRTLLRTKGRVVLGEPKTKKNRRTVHLTGAASRAFEEYLGHQLKEMERLGDLYRDQGLVVFTTEAGTPIKATNLRKRSFAPLLQKANLPRVRFQRALPRS
jgi:integrase